MPVRSGWAIAGTVKYEFVSTICRPPFLISRNKTHVTRAGKKGRTRHTLREPNRVHVAGRRLQASDFRKIRVLK